MRKISADWIFPVSSDPIENGVVIINEEGKILQLDERKNFEDPELEIYSGILCPGFVNAHCHLEGSYMKGKITERTGLLGFVSEFMKNRNDEDPSVQSAIEEADAEMWNNGIVGVGDISNEVTSFSVKSKSRIRYHTFVECFGLNAKKAQEHFNHSRKVFEEARSLNLNASITPHAPYSVPDELFQLIFFFTENHPSLFSYHNQETEEENKMSRGEVSRFDDLYKLLNLKSLRRNGKSSLMAHLKFFPSERKLLLVHNTFSTGEDFENANKYFSPKSIFSDSQQPKVYFCTCPIANLYIENQLPDYSFWKNFPDQICIGTDSLASNHQLSVLEEMKTIQLNYPSLSISDLIQWGTLNGAAFFGWENTLGSLEKAKTPGVNLISFVDSHQLQLTEESKIQRLI